MSGILKVVMIVIMIVYIVSPIDLAPGPFDDVIVLLLGLALQKKSIIGDKSSKKDIEENL